MRNKYFSENNISKKVFQFKNELNEINLLREIETIPNSTALLILDMQEYFLNPSSHAYIPSANAIISGIKKLHDEFINRNMLTIFTQHIDIEIGMMPIWWKNLISENNPLSNISAQLNAKDSIVITKTQYDGFWETNLDLILKEKQISDVVIVGVMTHLCCETTARSAFVRGYNVIFSMDGTATYNEVHHFSTLRNLAHGFAYLMTIPEIIDVLP